MFNLSDTNIGPSEMRVAHNMIYFINLNTVGNN